MNEYRNKDGTWNIEKIEELRKNHPVQFKLLLHSAYGAFKPTKPLYQQLIEESKDE